MIPDFADDGYGGLIQVPEKAFKLENVKERKVRPHAGPSPKTAPSAAPDPANFALLTHILKSKRHHLSKGDMQFREWLKKQLEGMGVDLSVKAGNLVATTDPKSDVMFSCHVDTCHSAGSSGEDFQNLEFDTNLGHIFLAQDSKTKGNVLGADDGAGIYIMLRMIAAKVPATYVFHVGEEVGCVGSRAMLAQESKWLEKFSLAVAFDRPQNYEVIHTQGGEACASIKCAVALAKALSTDELAYECSANGVLTDTKIYKGIIAECFNIGVGYAFQHSSEEYLDVYHLEALSKRCCEVDWTSLPIDRDPKVVPKPTYYGAGYQSPFQNAKGKGKKGLHGAGNGIYMPPNPPKGLEPKPKQVWGDPDEMGFKDLSDWVFDQPEEAYKYIIKLQVQLAAEIARSERLAQHLEIDL
jgi:hypothetical protein